MENTGGVSAERGERGVVIDGVFLDEAALDAKEVELAELSAHLDAAAHRQLTLIRVMDFSERWAQRGAKSCAHWLSWRVGLDPGAARERVRVARKLGELPAVSDSLRLGELSYSKARAITRVGTPANEERLLDMARHTTAAQLEKICRGVRQQQREDARLAGGRPVELERYVRLRHRGDGSVEVKAVLLPDEGHRTMEAVRLVCAAMSEGLEVKPDQADALVRIVDAVLAGDRLAGDRLAGDRLAGDRLAGDRLAGDLPIDVGNVSAETENDAAESNAAGSNAAESNAAESDAAESDAAESEQSGSGAEPPVSPPMEPERAEAHGEAPVHDRAPAAREAAGRARTCGADRAQVVVHFTADMVDGGHMVVLDDGGRVSA